MVSTNDEVVNEVSASDVAVAPAVAQVIEISEDEFEKAQKTFQLGKKNLFLNKYDESVNNIGDACKIYSSKYGEFGAQCAEVYFFYGRALLELARVENTVLGNALNGVPEDSEPIDDSRYGNPEDVAAEEKKDISDKVIDAMCEKEETTVAAAEPAEPVAAAAAPTAPTAPTAAAVNNEPTVSEQTNGNAKATNGDKVCDPISVATADHTETSKEVETGIVKEVMSAEVSSVETSTTTTATAAAAATPKTTTVSETTATATETATSAMVDEEEEDDEDEDEDLTKGDEQAKDEAEADDISNLQRSWEMFELAKLVYLKNFADNQLFRNKRVAECLLKLGEISIEQEIYDQAITDITESVRLQEETAKEERDDRMLAESFYQLGLAQQFNNLFAEANESYQKSINIMQLKIEKLKAKLETLNTASTTATDQSTNITDTDAELERNTIRDEIADLEALLPEMIAKLEEVNEQGQQSMSLIKEAKECFLSSIAADATSASAGDTAATTSAVTNGNGQVKDITCMLKSKRKICAEEAASNKKTRLSDSNDSIAVVANGGSNTQVGGADTPGVSNGNTNGHGTECVEMSNACDEAASVVVDAASASAETMQTETCTKDTDSPIGADTTNCTAASADKATPIVCDTKTPTKAAIATIVAETESASKDTPAVDTTQIAAATAETVVATTESAAAIAETAPQTAQVTAAAETVVVTAETSIETPVPIAIATE